MATMTMISGNLLETLNACDQTDFDSKTHDRLTLVSFDKTGSTLETPSMTTSPSSDFYEVKSTDGSLKFPKEGLKTREGSYGHLQDALRQHELENENEDKFDPVQSTSLTQNKIENESRYAENKIQYVNDQNDRAKSNYHLHYSAISTPPSSFGVPLQHNAEFSTSMSTCGSLYSRGHESISPMPTFYSAVNSFDQTGSGHSSFARDITAKLMKHSQLGRVLIPPSRPDDNLVLNHISHDNTKKETHFPQDVTTTTSVTGVATTKSSFEDEIHQPQSGNDKPVSTLSQQLSRSDEGKEKLKKSHQLRRTGTTVEENLNELKTLKLEPKPNPTVDGPPKHPNPTQENENPIVHQERKRRKGKKSKKSRRKKPEVIFCPSSEAYTPSINSKSKPLHYLPASERHCEAIPTTMGTISRPNFRDALRRVAMILHQHIVKIERRFEAKNMDPTGLFLPEMRNAFKEDNYAKPRYKCTMVRVPMARPGVVYSLRKLKADYETPDASNPSSVRVPTEVEIYEFAHKLFKKVQLSSECSIVCLIYIERLMEIAKVPMMACTWRPIFMAGLLLASKVWQDLSSWNIEFAIVYPQFSLESINRLELQFLRMVKWDLYISSSLYAKYYFALRSLLEKKTFRQRYNRMVGGVGSVDASDALKIQQRTEKVKEEALIQLSRSM